MSDDAINWVTVRVPEDDRELANDYKPDGVTWGDCLVAGAERLNDGSDSDIRTDPSDTPAVDVDTLVDELIDELGAAAGGPQVDDSALAREVVRQFDYAELANRTAEEVVEALR